ncbi:hypothetical protein BZG36_02414 [Bifiguratus adelaidae]|uniref:DH domain-containing protein n=1 Tax=Bifiguratus adelaidae TaxID=1938954 RepID=A0A261Y1A4_9FUNG|nr:hypothetical protein BZG36_02414 [Bifiguratus adelaidae]
MKSVNVALDPDKVKLNLSESMDAQASPFDATKPSETTQTDNETMAFERILPGSVHPLTSAQETGLGVAQTPVSMSQSKENDNVPIPPPNSDENNMRIVTELPTAGHSLSRARAVRRSTSSSDADGRSFARRSLRKSVSSRSPVTPDVESPSTLSVNVDSPPIPPPHIITLPSTPLVENLQSSPLASIEESVFESSIPITSHQASATPVASATQPASIPLHLSTHPSNITFAPSVPHVDDHRAPQTKPAGLQSGSVPTPSQQENAYMPSPNTVAEERAKTVVDTAFSNPNHVTDTQAFTPTAKRPPSIETISHPRGVQDCTGQISPLSSDEEDRVPVNRPHQAKGYQQLPIGTITPATASPRTPKYDPDVVPSNLMSTQFPVSPKTGSGSAPLHKPSAASTQSSIQSDSSTASRPGMERASSSASESQGDGTKRGVWSNDLGDFEPAFMSELALRLTKQLQDLRHVRELFCAVEYPESFTGRECIQTLRALLPRNLPEDLPLKLARSMIHAHPPVFFPLPYSELSVKRHTVIDSPSELYSLFEDASEECLPQGVFVPLLNCYSSSCRASNGPCYSPTCPNRGEPSGVDLRRQMSVTSLSSVSSSLDTQNQARAWSAAVPKEILEATSKDEIKRQEAIFELIYTEEDYTRDLELLEDLFVKQLTQQQCIPEDRIKTFTHDVFYNYLDIKNLHRDMCTEFRNRQYEGLFVDHIGDILVRFVNQFLLPYSTYGPHFVFSQYTVNLEMKRNPSFHAWVKRQEKQAETRRLPMRHFLIAPITRLQRYPLLIAAILKVTPEKHVDRAALESAIVTLKSVASKVDDLTKYSHQKLRLFEIHESLVFKDLEEPIDLDLLNDHRALIYEGELRRRSNKGVETLDLKVFIFDNFFVMTKMGKAAALQVGSTIEDVVYRVSKRPIRMEMLLLHIPGEEVSTRAMTVASHRTGTNLSTASSMISTATQAATNAALIGSALTSSSSNSPAPIQVSHIGRKGGVYTLLAPTIVERAVWKGKVIEAQAMRALEMKKSEVFELSTVDATHFGIGPAGITWLVPFGASDGRRLLAAATNTGVWVGSETPGSVWKLELSLLHVTQLAVMEEQHLFLVLADKVLWAYSLECLYNSTMMRSGQKIATHVNYFTAGVCSGRTLLVTMRRKGADSFFRALEPISTEGKAAKTHGRPSIIPIKPLPKWSKSQELFRVYKEFYVGAESMSVQFLKTKLIVVCAKGFEIVDMENLNMNRGLPDLRDPQYSFLARRSETLRPLAMFRVNDRHLLCYNEFAFFMDNHGNLIYDTPGRIVWEGSPDSIAFCYPYVMALEPQLIEIRHVETGNLVQIIQGKDIHLLHTNVNLSVRTSLRDVQVYGRMLHEYRDAQQIFRLTPNDSIRRL